jgi:hypothetical protein
VRRFGRSSAAVAIAIVVAGCGGSSPGGSSPDRSSVPSASSPAARSTTNSPPPTNSPASPTNSAASPTNSPSTTGSLLPTEVDPTLLGLLPPTVGGVPIVETPEAEYGSVADPALSRMAARLATAYAVSDAGGDWAVVSVVALRPGTFSEVFFRGWRDTYDGGVCEQTGGIGGRAEASIGGRDVHITTCGALHVYHVHLEARDVLVAVASAGEGRFGEQLMAGLRP